MSYIIPFQQLGKNAIAIAGGKGANLGELTVAGFPIPPGFVLATTAYDTFVQVHDLQRRIIDLASSVSLDDPQSSETASAKIEQLFLGVEIPDEIAEAVIAANAEFGNCPVAVRSSATAEDLPDASFAGQQETYLNVQDEEALLDAVKRCWASLWSARAISYRLKQKIAPDEVSIAIVIHKLIPADTAGILFTANPLDGDRDQMVINAAWGLGEAIVSGQVTPDTVIVDKSNWHILSCETATKTIMSVRIDKGTREQPVPSTQQNQPVLEDAAVIELAQYGAQIETHFGMPMDIEWAISGGEIAILQARPITNLPPAPLKDVRWDPPKPGTIWMRRQVVEHMPEPLSPLFDELYLREGLYHSMEAIGASLSELCGFEIELRAFIDPPFAATVNGYAYSIASFKFTPKLIPLVLRMYVKVLPQMIRHLIPRWRDVSLPAYLAVVARWESIDLTNASDQELLQGIRELAMEDAVYWFAAAVPLGLARTSDAAFDRFLNSSTAGRLTSGSFLRGFPSKTADAQIQLESIARKIDVSDSLQELVLDTPAGDLLAALADHPEGHRVLEDLQQYLDVYGHQIYNLDFAAPTLADDPLPVLLGLKAAVAHPEREVRLQQARLVRERDLIVIRTERSLNPVQRPIFRLLWGWARKFLPYRDEALFYVGAAWPTLRGLAHELGQRLTEAGSLETPDDVYYLESAELAAACAARTDGASRPELTDLARGRRALREARKRLEPPVSVPPDGRMKFGPIDMAMFEPKSRRISTGPILEGFAVSPGSVTAPASLIRSPEDFDRMKPDTILVCPTTTPAWTPLFAQAKGLVTDIGGALAHGSIVAREYGIPAVMGTGVATQRIKSGQRIRIDGDRGTVMLVDEVDEQEVERFQAQRLAEKRAKSQKRKLIFALAVGSAILAIWWKKRRKRR